jgi:hypothetical protein
MKFVAIVFAYLVISFVLGWGILLATHGNYWMLGISSAAYILAFSVLGCLPPRKSH